jgi:hypothetical protein
MLEIIIEFEAVQLPCVAVTDIVFAVLGANAERTNVFVVDA